MSREQARESTGRTDACDTMAGNGDFKQDATFCMSDFFLQNLAA